MYAEDYDEVEAGRSTYASLSADATACSNCKHEACLKACPYGLNLPERTRTTPKVLGLN